MVILSNHERTVPGETSMRRTSLCADNRKPFPPVAPRLPSIVGIDATAASKSRTDPERAGIRHTFAHLIIASAWFGNPVG